MALIKEWFSERNHSVIIQLPNKQLVFKATNHLFPLEMQTVDHESKDVKTSNDEPIADAELRSDSWYLRKGVQ